MIIGTIQNLSGFSRTSIHHQVVRYMRTLVQAHEALAIRRGAVFQHKPADRPDRVQFRFTINQMLEVGGDFQVRYHAA